VESGHAHQQEQQRDGKQATGKKALHSVDRGNPRTPSLVNNAGGENLFADEFPVIIRDVNIASHKQGGSD
jgi:hypothetical protein